MKESAIGTLYIINDKLRNRDRDKETGEPMDNGQPPKVNTFLLS